MTFQTIKDKFLAHYFYPFCFAQILVVFGALTQWAKGNFNWENILAIRRLLLRFIIGRTVSFFEGILGTKAHQENRQA